MQRFSALLDEDNLQAINGILTDIKTMTGTLSARQAQFGRIIDRVDTFSDELAATATAIRSVAAKLDKLADEADRTLGAVHTMVDGADRVVQEDVRALVVDLRETTQTLQSLSRNADAFLQENRAPLSAFAGDGLHQFTKFLNDASYLVTSMTRLTERLETEGARFLIGSKQSEFEVERQ